MVRAQEYIPFCIDVVVQSIPRSRVPDTNLHITRDASGSGETKSLYSALAGIATESSHGLFTEITAGVTTASITSLEHSFKLI